jgi:hypothetical protein
MKKLRITDKNGVVTEYDASEVTVEEIEMPDGFKPISPGAGNYFSIQQGQLQGTPCIRDEEHAYNYAEAMNVLFELWDCDGVVKLDMDSLDYVYQLYGDLSIAEYSNRGGVSLANITPPFGSRESLEAAIQKVGPERIKKMFRSFKFLK